KISVEPGVDMKFFIISMACFALYLFLVVPAVNSPLTTDELTWPIAAQSLIQNGKTVVFYGESVQSSPPLYVNTQVFLYKLLGVSNFSSRLIGIICVFFQLIVLSCFGKIFFNDKKEEWKFVLLTSLIFITNPAIIQGSLIPFEDMSLFPLLLALFALAFIKLAERPGLASALILGTIFAACLWPKFTTPLVLIPCMFVYYLLNKDSKGMGHAIATLLIGIFLFLSTWWAYANLRTLDFTAPINYAVSAFLSKQAYKQTASVFLGFSTNIIRFILWFGLYSFLLGAIALAKRISFFMKKKILEPVDFLVIYILFVGVTYTFVGGMTFGFPKYYFPIFLPLVILSVFTFKEVLDEISVKDAAVYIGTAVLTFFYFYFVVGDPIYFFNFSMREMIVIGEAPVKNVFYLFGDKVFFYVVPGVIVFLIVKAYARNRKLITRILITLLIMIFGANLALDVIHRRASYMTRYCYGEEGTEDLIEHLHRNLAAGDAVLATCDIIYYLRQKGHDVSYISDAVWYHTDDIEKIIGDPSVRFVVYSVGHNDINQFKSTILNPAFQAGLKRRFARQEVGTYTVWQRMR
ncbi:MAG: hypothetical protein PHI59_09965, partial [Candidatus Omnitrophica bacterium]|nr:hypothetical protein [Candidatus Omnitrophota bacterium]